MYVGQDWDDLEPTEDDVFSLEFTQDLQPGQSINTPVWSCALVQTFTGFTPDPSPNSRITGAANVTTEANPATGATRSFTNQAISGAVQGNRYLLSATVQTSDGRTLTRHSFFNCR